MTEGIEVLQKCSSGESLQFGIWSLVGDSWNTMQRTNSANLMLKSVIFGRGRNAGYPAPPAQIRTCATNAYGSYIESNTPTLPLHVVELIPETLL